ncbi:MAG: prolipoprotein diacylglyceryl transferase [Chloroflexi bacterium]|nr:prolipoprotein diacylglyceryl transferase [Chloroflexota bacterium]
MDPNILVVGPLVLAWHGLLIGLGVLAGVLVAAQIGKRLRYQLSDDAISAIALWAVPGGIVGGRLAHVVDRWDFYASNPASVLAITEGGMAIWGSVLGGSLAAWLYVKRQGLPVGQAADLGAFGLLVGQIIGRVGCLINGDAYGAPTEVPWAVVYTHPGAFAPLGVPTHPWPVYEILWSGLTLALLWRLMGRVRPEGMLFLLYLAAYAVGRFFLTFLRQERILFLGLQEAHLISLLVLAVVVPALVYLSLTSATTRRMAPSRH